MYWYNVAMSCKKKPHVFILHGWAINQQNDVKWYPFINLLQKNDILATFLGIPGLSSPLNEVWALQDFVDWLKKQLPKQDKVILLGHSFGGQIAIRFTAQNPDMVEKLILIDSAGIRDHAFFPTVKRKVFWVAAKVGKVLFNVQWAKKLLYKIARERDYNNAPPLLKRSMSLILDDEVIDDLPKISCPTLLIWGENDTVTPIKLAYQKMNLLPAARLKVISQARHAPQFTHTKQVVECVSLFLRPNTRKKTRKRDHVIS